MVSIKDVAKESGYSVATVSAVLRNSDKELGIKPSTSEKILKAAEKLGYVKSNIALEMKKGYTKTFVHLRPKHGYEYLGAAMNQAEFKAMHHDYSIRNIIYESDDREKMRGLLDKIISIRPAALITCADPGPNKKMIMDYCSKYHLAHVSIDFNDPDVDIRIVTDDHAGIGTAVDHLVSHGHTCIAHATDTLIAQYADVRFRAFQDAVKRNGLKFDESICYHDYYTPQNYPALTGYAERIMAMKNRPSAIVCGSDHIAVKLMMILMQLGVRIPDDISIIGYGGISASKLTIPQLTTIRQPFEEMAETAVEELMKFIRKEPYRKHLVIDPMLIPGGTTASIRKKNSTKTGK